MSIQKKFSFQFLASLIFLVAIDQSVKFFFNLYLSYGDPIAITSFFNLRLLYNPGIAFSFFASGNLITQIILTSFSFIFAIAALFYLRTVFRSVERWSIGLLIAGALGNGIDRLRLGYVIDYLDFYLYGWHWPTFNIADIFVSLGAIALISAQLFFTNKK